MTNSSAKKNRARSAFTLIETILALAISALVMFGCASLMFDMVGIVEYFEHGTSLKSHADGVEKYLRCAFMNSRFADSDKIEEKLIGNASKTLFAAKLPSDIRSAQYYICYGVQGAHPLFAPFRGLSGEKLCWLVLDDQGLAVIWRYADSEDEDGNFGLFRTNISKYVGDITYLYPDGTTWKEERDISTSETSLPSFIKIVFERGGERIERIINLTPILDFQIAR